MVNALSELQKRAIAYSGQADIGDVPPLYAARRAAEQAAAEQALGGTGQLPSGGGGVAPVAAAGGGGAVGGSADFGLPGTTGDPAIDQALASGYRDVINAGRADPRGPPGRDAQNPDVEAFLDDYFGFLKNPAVIGASAPFVGPFAAALGPLFGATDIPEAAPLTPSAILAQLFGGPTVEQGTAERVGTGIAAPSEEAAAAIAQELNQQLGLPSFGSGLSSGDRGGGPSEGGGGGFGCFAGGTLVLMADMTEKPIEHIRIGDEVMGFYEAGEPTRCRVIGTFAHKDKPVVRLNGGTLVTRNHRFFAETHENAYEFVPIEEVSLGGTIMGVEGEKRLVETLEDAGEFRDVFNLTVEGAHTYFANGYRVHNIKHFGGPVVAPEDGGEVEETLLDGEFVLNPQATKMLGHDFLNNVNHMARLASRK